MTPGKNLNNQRNLLGDVTGRKSTLLSEQQDLENSQESSEELDKQRLLHVNRRRLNINRIAGDKVTNTDSTITGRIANERKWKENAGETQSINTDNERLLHLNRRRLNLNKDDRTQTLRSDEITKTRSAESSEERDLENIVLQRPAIENNRLLKINRRRLNLIKKNSQESSEELNDIGSNTQSDESREERDVEESIKLQVPIDGNNRLLKVNRRRLNLIGMKNLNMERSNDIENSKESPEELKERSVSTADNSDRLLWINRRRMNQLATKLNRIDQNENENVRRINHSLESSEEEKSIENRKLVDDLKTTEIDNDRLLKVSSRRNKFNTIEGGLDINKRTIGDRQPLSRSTIKSNRDLLQSSIEDSNNEEVQRIRLTRSIETLQMRSKDPRDLRAGELFLHNIQQIIARLRMERLSNILEAGLENGQTTKIKNRKIEELNQIYARALKQLNRPSLKNPIIMQQIEDVDRILKTLINTELDILEKQGQLELQAGGLLNTVGEILLSRLGNTEIRAFDIWQLVQELINSVKNENSKPLLLTNYGQQLSNPIIIYILETIVRTAALYNLALPSYTQKDLILEGVTLNDVKVDELQTYFDSVDSDLINLLQLHASKDMARLQKPIVARQKRLTHKSFNIKIDLSAEESKTVVIRIFLGPKLNQNSNTIVDINENRQNFMLLDAFDATLKSGRNVIQRSSKDLTGATVDSTPYTELYKNVLQSLDGNRKSPLTTLSHSNCRFHARLLLPRGLPQGLPMQLLIVVTPQMSDDLALKSLLADELICGIGTAALNLDRLPLAFPLERKIDRLQELLVPNVMLKDVLIYHDEI